MLHAGREARDYAGHWARAWRHALVHELMVAAWAWTVVPCMVPGEGMAEGIKKVAREPLDSLDTVSRSQSHTRRKLGPGQEEGRDPHPHRTGRGDFQGIWNIALQFDSILFNQAFATSCRSVHSFFKPEGASTPIRRVPT